AVHISDLAEDDIDSAYRWWRDNRSIAQAAKWLDQIHDAIETLSVMPYRCPRCEEADLHEVGVRQLLFGIGRRATHRILFVVIEDEITILRVRHVAQHALRLDELT